MAGDANGGVRIEIKRDSMQIVGSIVSEDIGKFPDNNIVEARSPWRTSQTSEFTDEFFALTTTSTGA